MANELSGFYCRCDVNSHDCTDAIITDESTVYVGYSKTGRCC